MTTNQNFVFFALDSQVGQFVGRIQISDDRFGAIRELRYQHGILKDKNKNKSKLQSIKMHFFCNVISELKVQLGHAVAFIDEQKGGGGMFEKILSEKCNKTRKKGPFQISDSPRYPTQENLSIWSKLQGPPSTPWISNFCASMVEFWSCETLTSDILTKRNF